MGKLNQSLQLEGLDECQMIFVVIKLWEQVFNMNIIYLLHVTNL